MQEISPQDAFEEISSGRALGVDVRESDEWVAGHAEKVTWNPMSAFDMSLISDELPTIFICRSGNRSGQVASSIAALHPTVSNMTGGMKAWCAAGLPMVSDNGNPEVA